MKALVLVQSTQVDTYVNIFGVICDEFPEVSSIRLLYITEDNESVTVQSIRERLVELSQRHTIYEKAADVSRDSDRCNMTKLAEYVRDYDIVDVTGVSKEIAVNMAAIGVLNKSTRVCVNNWLTQFKKGEEWILDTSNHEYVDLFGKGDLDSLRKNYFQKRSVIFASAGVFALLSVSAVLKMVFPDFFIPEVLVNIFGLLIGVAGLYVAAQSLKY